MNWQLHATLPWADPLELAARVDARDMALLYSSLAETHSGGSSFLFLQPIETREGTSWNDFPALPAQADGMPLWVGYLGYELSDLTSLPLRERARVGPVLAPSALHNAPHLTSPLQGEERPHNYPHAITQCFVTLPALRLTRYAELYRFNHNAKTVEHFVVPGNAPQPLADATINPEKLPKITSLASNFRRAEYEATVRDTVAEIQAGNFYQANITRKFWGEFESAPDSFALFQKLCAASPAPYSAYIRHSGSAILSSSPECFLRVEEGGRIITRPIKGSARRGADAAEDAEIQKNLTTSSKNHAENLMIVDLMRNDLARVSCPQSVRVTERSGLYSYATIHHLISTIEAEKQPAVGVAEVIRASFPPGSMTGAPKIAAMRWCAARERLARGVYSGGIGWLGAGDTCDLSVVIRTLILDGNRLEFQVGGGIVADSTPEDEWRETIIKARGIMAALGITEQQLEAL